MFRVNTEQNDFPFSGEPRIVYAVCGTPRCGSNLLCGLLQQTGRMGFPTEFFNVRHLADWRSRMGGRPALDALIPFIKARRTSPNGVFGFKAFAEHFYGLAKNARIERHFPRLRYVYLERRDVLGQAISLWRAIQTDSWNFGVPEMTTPRYRRYDIERQVDQILLARAGWERFFALYGIQPYRLQYDELSADPIGTLRGVMTALGVELGELAVDEQRLPAPQRDPINAAWRDRIRARYQTDRIRAADVDALRRPVPARVRASKAGLRLFSWIVRRTERPRRRPRR